MPRVCELEPFLYPSTPQPEAEEGASGGQINEQVLEGYLERMREAMCEDLQELQAAIDALDVRVTALETP